MTKAQLRDIFASSALTGILANDRCMQQAMKRYGEGIITSKVIENVVIRAFQYADEMVTRSDQFPK